MKKLLILTTDQSAEEKTRRNSIILPLHKTKLVAGSVAPRFEGYDQHGNLIRLSDFAGKTLILYFYPKDDTPGCTATSCNLRDAYHELIEDGYQVVGVSADDMKSHSKFAVKYNLPFPLIADTDRTIINSYDVWGPKVIAGNEFIGIVRTTFVIDGSGVIKDVISDVNTLDHAAQIRSR